MSNPVLKAVQFDGSARGEFAAAASEGRRDGALAAAGLIGDVDEQKLAGIVIVYVPPLYAVGNENDGRKNPLVAMRVSYGRGSTTTRRGNCQAHDLEEKDYPKVVSWRNCSWWQDFEL